MENWLTILQQIFQVCIVPLLGILTAYLVKYIQVKGKELSVQSDNELAAKYIDMLTQTISDCVIATNQTYVEALKDKNVFTEEAQKEAFNRTYTAVMAILSEDAKEYLTQAFGDLESYVTKKIEAEVNANKI